MELLLGALIAYGCVYEISRESWGSSVAAAIAIALFLVFAMLVFKGAL